MATDPTNKRTLDPVTFLYTGQITSSDVHHVRSKGNMIVKPLVAGGSNAGGLKIFGNQQKLPSSREYDRYTIGVKFPGDVETATFHVSKDGGSTYYGANHWTVVSKLEVLQKATLVEEHLKVDPVKISDSAYGYTYIVKKSNYNELRFAYIDNVQDTTTSYFIESSDKNFIRHARVTKLDNRLICAHYDSTSPVEVHFKVSDDNGTSWTELAILSDDSFDNERRFGIVGGKSTIWALIPKTDDMYLYQSLNDATSFSQFSVFKSGMPDSKCTNVDMHYSEISGKYHVAQASDSTGMTIWESNFGNSWTGKVTLQDTYTEDSAIKIPLAFCEFEDHTLELLFKIDTTTSYNAYTRNFNRGTGLYSDWSSNTERVLQIQNTGDYFDNIGLLVHQGVIHFYGNAIDQNETVSDLVHLEFQNRSEATFENEYANSYYPSFGLPDDVGWTVGFGGLLDSCEVPSDWVRSGFGEGDPTLNSSDYKEGTGSLNLSARWFQTAFARILPNPVNGTGESLFMWFRIDDPNNLDIDYAVRIHIGSDLGSYFLFKTRAQLSAGWNLIGDSLSNFTITGSPNIEALNYISIVIYVDSSEVTIPLGEIGMDHWRFGSFAIGSSLVNNNDLLLDATSGNISYRFVNPLIDESSAGNKQALWNLRIGSMLTFEAKIQDHDTGDGGVTMTLDDCDAITDWVNSSSASVPVLNTVNFKEGVGSLDLGKTTTINNEAKYSKNIGVTNLTDTSCGLYFYIQDKNELHSGAAAVRVRFDENGSNWFYKDYARVDLVDVDNDSGDGWNTLGLDTNLQNWSKNGNPDTSSIATLGLYFYTPTTNDTIASGNAKMDYWRSETPGSPTVDALGKLFIDIQSNQESPSGPGGYRKSLWGRLELDSTEIRFGPALLGGTAFEDATTYGHDFTHSHNFALVQSSASWIRTSWDLYMSEVNINYVQEWDRILSLRLDATTVWEASIGDGYIEIGVFAGNIKSRLRFLNENIRNLHYIDHPILLIVPDYDPLDKIGITTSYYNYTIDRGVQVRFDGIGGELVDIWATDITTNYLPINMFDLQSDQKYLSDEDATAHSIVLSKTATGDLMVFQGTNFDQCTVNAQNSGGDDWSNPDISFTVDFSVNTGLMDSAARDYFVAQVQTYRFYEYNDYYVSIDTTTVMFLNTFDEPGGNSNFGHIPDSTTIGQFVGDGKFGSGMTFMTENFTQMKFDRWKIIDHYWGGAMQGFRPLYGGGLKKDCKVYARRTYDVPRKALSGAIADSIELGGLNYLAGAPNVFQSDLGTSGEWISFNYKDSVVLKGVQHHFGVIMQGYASNPVYDTIKEVKSNASESGGWTEKVINTEGDVGSRISNPIVGRDKNKVLIAYQGLTLRGSDYQADWVILESNSGGSVEMDMTSWLEIANYGFGSSATQANARKAIECGVDLCRGENGTIFLAHIQGDIAATIDGEYPCVISSYDDGTNWEALQFLPRLTSTDGKNDWRYCEMFYNDVESRYEYYANNLSPGASNERRTSLWHSTDATNWTRINDIEIDIAVTGSERTAPFAKKFFVDEDYNETYCFFGCHAQDSTIFINKRTSSESTFNGWKSYVEINNSTGDGTHFTDLQALGIHVRQDRFDLFVIKNMAEIIRLKCDRYGDISFDTTVAYVETGGGDILSGGYHREDFEYALDAITYFVDDDNDDYLEAKTLKFYDGLEHRYYQQAFTLYDRMGNLDYDNKWDSTAAITSGSYTRDTTADLAINFSIGGQHLSYNNDALIQAQGSIAMWIKPTNAFLNSDATHSYMFAICKDKSSFVNQLFLGKIGNISGGLNGLMVGIVDGAGGYKIKGNLTIDDDYFVAGTWMHIAATWDGAGDLKLYKNGVEETDELATGTGIFSPPGTLIIGGTNDILDLASQDLITALNYESCEATLDDVRIDNVAWSADFIKSLYAKTSKFDIATEKQFTTKIITNTIDSFYVKDDLIAKGATTGCFYKIFNNKGFKVFDLSTYDFWEINIPAQKTYEGYYQISHFNLGTAIELTDDYFAGAPIKEKMGSAKDIVKIFKYDDGQSEAVKQGIDIREWEIPYSLLNEANDDILKDMFEAQEGSLKNFWIVMYHKGEDEQFYMVRFLSDYNFNTKHFDHGDVSLKLEEVRYESDG